MPRVKRSVHAQKKRRAGPRAGEGLRARKRTHYRYAKEQVEHSLVYAYRDRKNKKRTFRRLWITRINAAARKHALSYNQFIARLRQGRHRARPQGPRGSAVSDPAAFGGSPSRPMPALTTASADHLPRQRAAQARPQAP